MSIADHEVISQASYDRAMENGGSISKYELNRSKGMMFEDLVLQSITYDGETLKLTVPDYLPESQRWAIGIGYWEIDKDYDMSNIKNIKITEPGTYSYSGIKLLAAITINITPKNSGDSISTIFVSYQKPLSLDRLEKPEVDFNNIKSTFEWVQGQGYKDYIKNYQFDENDIEIAW